MTNTNSSNQAPALVTDESAVLAAIGGQYAAWAANDVDAFAAFYAQDATVVQPGVYKKDREEIRRTMAAAFAGPLKGSRVLGEIQGVRFLGPDVAVVISLEGILLAGETDLAADRQVRATWLLARQDGTWLIAALQTCAAG
jgi:uncharacterized protein (TIGR02246 family)